MADRVKSSLPKRKKYLAKSSRGVRKVNPKRRASYIKRSTKPIRKVNPKAKAKRSAKYKAFLSSAKWKQLRREALERAGHRCQEVWERQWVYDLTGEYVTVTHVRCTSTTRLHVDHESYARFGGRELPSDLKVRCFDCHMMRHALEGKRIG